MAMIVPFSTFFPKLPASPNLSEWPEQQTIPLGTIDNRNKPETHASTAGDGPGLVGLMSLWVGGAPGIRGVEDKESF